MRKGMLLVLAALVVATAIPTYAELQNVQVGGVIRIRGNYYSNTFESPSFDPDWQTVTGANGSVYGTRWTMGELMGRPVGNLISLVPILPVTGNSMSPFSWNSKSNALDNVEQRTRLSVDAMFTNDVSAFIELDSYNLWGEDFRSDFVTGVDSRPSDSVSLEQAYIQASEMWGMPLRARIGRQEISLGNEWLVGNNDANSFFTGLSFDALRLTYATDMFSLDTIAAKLSESGVAEEDGDAWLYGLYASYLGIENMQFDAYALLLRDPRSLGGPGLIRPLQWIEDVARLDDYDVSNLYTVGLRGHGTIGAFDFEGEAAYQFGEVDNVGSTFIHWRPGIRRPVIFPRGADNAEAGVFGANGEVGYTFDITWQPRVSLGGAYLGGEDNRDMTFRQMMRRFWHPDASVSFNRMFSNVEYSKFLDTNGDLSNAWLVKGGVGVKPTESTEANLTVAYLATLEEFNSPAYWTLNRWVLDGYRRVVRPIARVFPGRTQQNSDELGWEVELSGTYHYTEDLSFKAGWAHLFTGDGLKDGNYTSWNGLLNSGGSSNDDADYLYAETQIKF